MEQTGDTRLRFVRVLAWVGGILIASVIGYSIRESLAAGTTDFTAFYFGASRAGSSEIYDAEATYQWQVRTLGVRIPELIYIRPPFHALMLKPLTLLEYKTAFVVFLLLNAAVAAWYVRRFAWKDQTSFLAAMWFPPTWIAILQGQDVWLVAGLLGLAFLWMGKGRDFAAGLVLSLCTFKGHLLIFVPLALLLQRRWRVLAGAAAGGCLLLAASFPAAGPQWPERYLNVLANPVIHPGASIMPNLRSPVSVLGLPGWMFWLPAAAVAGMTFLVCRHARDWRISLAAALAGGLLVTWHAYLQDALVLLPGFLLWKESGLNESTTRLWMLWLSPAASLMVLLGEPSSALFALGGLAVLGHLTWTVWRSRASSEAGHFAAGGVSALPAP